MERGNMELVNEKMTNLANAIRGKTGETASLTIDEMTVAVESIESGGSGDGGTVDTCTVTITSSADSLNGYACTIINNNKIDAISNTTYIGTTYLSTPVVIENVLCNSCFLISESCGLS
jgi:hypothetical protein